MWVLVNALAWVVIEALIRPLNPFFESNWGTVAFVVAVSMTGAVLGAMQWLVLRRWVNQFRRWVMVSTVGTLVAAFPTGYFQVLDMYIGPRLELDALLSGAAFGIALGSIQWLALRRRMHRAPWWIVANAIGWSVSFFVGDVLSMVWEEGRAIISYGITTGGVAAAITGVALVVLLRNPVSDESDSKQSTA